MIEVVTDPPGYSPSIRSLQKWAPWSAHISGQALSVLPCSYPHNISNH